MQKSQIDFKLIEGLHHCEKFGFLAKRFKCCAFGSTLAKFANIQKSTN